MQKYKKNISIYEPFQWGDSPLKNGIFTGILLWIFELFYQSPLK
jgi:hypothetical protein